MSKKDLSRTPIENFFNLPTSEKEEKEETHSEIVPNVIYDEKDDQVEGLLANIHDIALNTHDKIMDDLDGMEAKYSARTYEVAANYLNIALNAADKRVKLKEHKDKLVKASGKAASVKNITNNTITLTTAELIKQIKAENAESVIDVEAVEIKNEDTK
jgi:hypothetical protein